MTVPAAAPYRIVIVDDERIARLGLRTMLSKYQQLRVVAEARDGDEAIRTIRAVQPDIVFVDIRMPGPDGFSVLRDASTMARRPVFIFVTAHAERALEAYDADAVDYLLKPFNESRLSRTVHRAIQYLRGRREPTWSPRDDRLLLHTSDGAVFVDAADVCTVRVDGNYLRVRTPASEYVVRQTLAAFGRDLNRPGFLRISRSTLVNLARVRAVCRVGDGRYVFELADGVRVVSSRRYLRDVRSALTAP